MKRCTRSGACHICHPKRSLSHLPLAIGGQGTPARKIMTIAAKRKKDGSSSAVSRLSKDLPHTNVLSELAAKIDAVEEGAMDSLLEDTDFLSQCLASILALDSDTEAPQTPVDSEESWLAFVNKQNVSVAVHFGELVESGEFSEDELEEIMEDLEEEILPLETEDEDDENVPMSEELRLLTEPVEDESDLEDEYEDDDDGEDGEDENENDSEDEEEDDGSEDSPQSWKHNQTPGKKDMFAEEEPEGARKLSSFEKAQAALRNQIATLEAENVAAEKPWTQRGEITGRQRPQDSLLEEAVEFDHLSRPVPQVTEARTEEIEDIIKRRIQEAAWDDVIRRDPRDLTLLAGMKDLPKGPAAKPLLEDVMGQGEKKSLAQVYEQDTDAKLRLQQGELSVADEETLKKRSLLTALFAKICRHIDGLSENLFVPKVYAQSDIQIKTLGTKGRK